MIMDYEKAYKEALDRAKKINCDGAYANQGTVIGMIFPELTESEDEKIRKAIIEEFVRRGQSSFGGYPMSYILAWLEKQKKQKPEPFDVDFDYEENVDLAGNAIGFIDVGAGYLNNRCRAEVVRWLKSVPETIKKLMGTIEQLKKQKEQKPTLNWRTIEQATTKRTDEGDCVTTERMLIKGLIDDEDYRIIDKDVMVNKNLLCIPVSELNAEEQKSCDDLDSEIKRFFDECIVVHEAEIYGRKERVIEVENYELIARHFANWQKEQKPVEWSEDDERALNNAIVSLSMYANGEIPLMLPSLILENVEQLKSIRDKGTTCTPHWKPSEEQMRCLESLPSLLRNFKLDTTAQMIEEIHDKLKKL